MREIKLQIPDADNRWDSRLVWEPNYEITVYIQYNTPIIKGNSAGLISLAKFLLILAQDEAKPGDHRHFDAGELDVESDPLIISRT
jgi:hypothetical protein